MLYPRSYGDNPLFPQARDFEVVRKDNSSGMGVFTRRAFSRDEIVALMHGEIVSDIRQHTLQIGPDKHLLDLHFAGYLLHSCSPNVHLNMKTMLVTAVRDIPANSYLTMDYAQTEDVLYKQFPCSCGSDNCRGWISGRKELPMHIMGEALIAETEVN